MGDKREVWQRGPLENIPGLLQPVAHALLQAREELHDMMNMFPERLLWERPSGVASPAFHLQHLTGVLDRLFTYAKGEQLNRQQMEYLNEEGKENATILIQKLVSNFDEQVDESIVQLENTPESSLLDTRAVGRKAIPSNVLGLLFHAAEHTQRHTGQLLVTVRVLST